MDPAYRAALDRAAASAIDAILSKARDLNRLDPAEAIHQLAMSLVGGGTSREEFAATLAALAVQSVNRAGEEADDLDTNRALRAERGVTLLDRGRASVTGPAATKPALRLGTRVAYRLDVWTRRARHAVVVGACRTLRHPTEDVTYASGPTWTRCPCRYIEVSTRGFAA